VRCGLEGSFDLMLFGVLWFVVVGVSLRVAPLQGAASLWLRLI